MTAATDDFAKFMDTPVGPVKHLALVTPDDSNDLAHITRGIWLSAAGAVTLTTEGGETITIPSGTLAAGVPHPIRATRIFLTGTAAITIMAGW